MLKRLSLTAILAATLWGVAGTTAATAHSSKWPYSSISRGLMCVHHYEGAWNANTGNGYYGGLQMDSSFERTYGSTFVRRWGHAYNWPVWAQLQAGINGALARHGFNAWPNTGRLCGLPMFF